MIRPAATLPVLSGIVAALCGPPAFGQVRTCSPVSIEVDPAVSTRWPEMAGHLRERFDGRDAIDRCARARVSLRHTSVIIEVVLPDGRSATRSVSRREDVGPTLEALLLVPRRSAPVETSVPETSLPPASPEPSPLPQQALPPGTPDVGFNGGFAAPERDVLAPSSSRRSSRVRIDLSAVTGARLGDGQASVGAGALSFLDLSGWLIGFQGRADRYQALASDDWSGWALELALLGGHRFYFHGVGLDLDAGPALIPQGTTTFAQSPKVTASSSSTVPRLVLGGRLSLSPRSIVHTFVGIDGEVGPARLGADLPHAPRLPIWTLGLALGATVGTQ